jgi:hypothetical protein
MATKPTTAVATVEPNALARPTFLPQHDARGTEHLTKDDMQMPRLALAQQMSPELVEGDPKFIDGLKSGQMFNSLTGHIYGKGPIEFTILRADPPRWVEFVPREEGGGVKDPNVPHNDPRTQFTTDAAGKSVPPVATMFYDFVVLLLDNMEPVALSFKSTGLKVARQLNSLMKMRNAPCFAGKYKLGTTMAKNAQGVFSVYTVSNSDIASPHSAVGPDGKLLTGWVNEPIFKQAEQLFEAFKDKVLVIDRDQAAADPDDMPSVVDLSQGDTSFDTTKM